MAGVSPRDGHELRCKGGDGTRVAAIDLTFSAPKSVSALWASPEPSSFLRRLPRLHRVRRA
jgi:hypothetical protein